MDKNVRLSEAIADILQGRMELLEGDGSEFLAELDALPREYGTEVRRVKKLIHDGKCGSQLYHIYTIEDAEICQQEVAELLDDICTKNLMNRDLAKKTVQIFLDAFAWDKEQLAEKVEAERESIREQAMPEKEEKPIAPPVVEQTMVLPKEEVSAAPAAASDSPAYPQNNVSPVSAPQAANNKNRILLAVLVVLLCFVGYFAIIKSDSEKANSVARQTTAEPAPKAADTKTQEKKEEVKTEPPPRPEPEKKPEKKPDTSAAQSALIGYYNAIGNGNMQKAYNTLSQDMKKHMGSLSSFSNGYQTTLSNKVSNVKVLSGSEERVVLNYTLTARDSAANHRVWVQVFEGTATLRLDGGNWYIADMKVKKQGEHYE